MHNKQDSIEIRVPSTLLMLSPRALLLSISRPPTRLLIENIVNVKIVFDVKLFVCVLFCIIVFADVNGASIIV